MDLKMTYAFFSLLFSLFLRTVLDYYERSSSTDYSQCFLEK